MKVTPGRSEEPDAIACTVVGQPKISDDQSSEQNFDAYEPVFKAITLKQCADLIMLGHIEQGL